MALPQFFEVKLEAGDTRAALTEKKMRAEMSFRQVSEDYHVVWLNCRDHSKSSLAELEELKSLNLEVAQPPAAGVGSNSEAYVDWLYASFKRLQDRFGQFLQRLSQATGIEVKHAPLKAKKRVLEKAFYDYQGDYSRVVDICRGSGVAEDLAGVVKAMKWVLESQHCHVVRFKNRFCDGRRDIMARGGYRDILVNLELAGGAGFVFELQIHLRPLFVMKDEAHKVLDLARAVIEPTLLKLSLLDAQESHTQLVHKVKQLELQVSGLTIEAAVQGQRGQGKQQVVADKNDEWRNKYKQLQQTSEQSQQRHQQLQREHEQVQQKCAQLQQKCAQLQREGDQSQQKYSQLQQQYGQSQNKCEQMQQESKLSQQKYAKLQSEAEQAQQTISQLKAEMAQRDAEIQTLKQRKMPQEKQLFVSPVSEDRRPPGNTSQDAAVRVVLPVSAANCWCQDPYITNLRPPSFVLHGEALHPRLSELTSKIKLQPNDAIIFAFVSSILDGTITFVFTQRELFHLIEGWSLLLSQIRECSLTPGSGFSTLVVITVASGETKVLRTWARESEFVKKVLMFAARRIKS